MVHRSASGVLEVDPFVRAYGTTRLHLRKVAVYLLLVLCNQIQEDHNSVVEELVHLMASISSIYTWNSSSQA